jgi:hypothetical protein
MFDISKILKRAWQILWDYKVLWVFGFLIALAGGSSSGGGGGGGSNASYRFSQGSRDTFSFDKWNAPLWLKDTGVWFQQHIGPWFATEASAIHTILWIVLILVGLGILIGLLFALVRYPAETAVMRMVDEHEQTGSKMKFKQGWNLGWNIRAFRVWLVDTIISIPGLLIAIIIAGAVALTLLNVANSGNPTFFPRVWLILAIIGVVLFLPFLFVMIVLGILRQFVVRYAAIEGTSIGESFSRGWALFKGNLKNVLLIWLVMLGIGIGLGFAMVLAAILLVPAYAVMAIPGALVAAITGAIGYGITSIFSAQVLPWIIGGLVALPFFLTIVFSPLTFVGGLVGVFSSNVWTLTYRQVKMLSTPPPPMPATQEEVKPAE